MTIFARRPNTQSIGISFQQFTLWSALALLSGLIYSNRMWRQWLGLHPLPSGVADDPDFVFHMVLFGFGLPLILIVVWGFQYRRTIHIHFKSETIYRGNRPIATFDEVSEVVVAFISKSRRGGPKYQIYLLLNDSWTYISVGSRDSGEAQLYAAAVVGSTIGRPVRMVKRDYIRARTSIKHTPSFQDA